MNAKVLEITGLRKIFGKQLAVDDVNLYAEEGQIVGLIGANGAGKSTTLNMTTGLIEPTSGTIMVDGLDLRKKRGSALSRMNIASTYTSLPGSLTVRESLLFYGRLYSVRQVSIRVDELIEIFDLSSMRTKLLRNLSTGQRVRVNLAKALINNPRLLILDEAFSNLDPIVALGVQQYLEVWVGRNSSAILTTSHNMADIETYCNYVYVIKAGRIIASGSPAGLKHQYSQESLAQMFFAANHPGDK